MKRDEAVRIVRETFESPFDRERFKRFIRNLLNEYEEAEISRTGNYIPDAYKDYVSKYVRLGKYEDSEDKRLDILVVYLKKETSIERARSMQRNFIAGYLQGRYGTDSEKDAALVAFVAPNGEDWRFSLVRLEIRIEAGEEGKIKVKDEFTPAKRWSFLVGSHEKSHTAQTQFVPIMEDTENNPTLAELEEAFNIEKVTKEFFEKYRALFVWTKDELDKAVKKNPKTKADFESKGIDTVNFAKKLMGQIVFLYFLQKKGWFGVPKDATWGEGSRNFLRELFTKCQDEKKNFFNDYLEPLFYEALRLDRSHDDHYYSRFDCMIPFLNGGLFDPMNNYDWVKTEILLSNDLFSNKKRINEVDTGDGILDIFDRYNFTVREDEPFEKEVAIDPELLGKAYEKFNAIRPDNYAEYRKALESGRKGEESKFNKQYGVYYTPREIVHYMCQQSLINYLYSELNPNVVYQSVGNDQLDMFGNAAKSGQLDMTVEHRPMTEVPKADIETLILRGEQIKEHDERVMNEGRETKDYPFLMPETIRANAALIDGKLATIKVCDPAVGSGAFPVGMMSEIVKARGVLAIYKTSEVSETSEVSTYHFKRECIENSLYGVDIDSGAVEIAKLRLWLSLVVDEDDPQNIKPLPNLDYKIVQGNSLIGVEKNLFNVHLFAELESLKPLFFNATNPTKKHEYKKKIDGLIDQITDGRAQFDFEIYFSEVFHEKGGFNVVVANPPYIDSERMTTSQPSFRKIYAEQFLSAKGNWDIFVIFIERGMKLLCQNGVITYIVPNKLVGAPYAETIRSMMIKLSIMEIRDYSKVEVFEDVAVYPITFVLSKFRPSSNEVSAVVMKSLEEVSTRNLIPAKSFYAGAVWDKWFVPNKELSVVSKCSKHPTLSGFCAVSSAATVSDAYEIKKIIKEHSPGHTQPFKKLVNTGTIDRYTIHWSTEATQYLKDKYLAPIIPDSKLKEYSAVRFEQASSEKIIVGGMNKYLECAYDNGKILAGKSTSIILNPKQGLSLKFILGILNSKLISFWYGVVYRSLTLAGGYIRIDHNDIGTIPISIPETNIQNQIIKLVERVLAAKAKNPAADTSELERGIDQLVYELYGLTEEEIAIVEGKGS